jgi:hypothetical protein
MPIHDEPGDSMTVNEFCARNRISKQFYYKLRARGDGPVEMRLGSRVLISKEEAADWRRRMARPLEDDEPPGPDEAA